MFFTFGNMDGAWVELHICGVVRVGFSFGNAYSRVHCTTSSKFGRHTRGFTLVLEKHHVQSRWVGSLSIRPRVHLDLARVHLGRYYLLIYSQLHHELAILKDDRFSILRR